MKNRKNITYVIRYSWGGYDLLAIGDLKELKKVHKTLGYSQLFIHSKFGGIPVLLIDTFFELEDAKDEMLRLSKQKTDRRP